MLFASGELQAENESDKLTQLKELLAEIKGRSARGQLIDQESPELKGLLEEFDLALHLLMYQVAPLLNKKDFREKNKSLATFVDLKHNLLLNYCTFLSFYLLLKLDKTKQQDDVRAHPVLFKLTALKQTLDGLAPLDDKLEKALKSKGLGSSARKQSDSYEIEGGKDDDDEEEAIADDEEGEEEGEEDMEDDISVGDDQLTKTELYQINEESKRDLAKRLKKLDEDEVGAIVQSASHSKKAAKQRLEDEKLKQEQEEKIQKDAKKNREQYETQKKKKQEEDAAEQERLEKKRESKLLKKEQAKDERGQLDRQIDRQNQSITRNVNYTIMKSKGLTRKRKKIDRNSRVKFREKYSKAIQKRKSRVQDFQEGPKGKYGGESSGLKVGLIKSVHLS